MSFEETSISVITLDKLSRLLIQQNCQSYIVGGFLRDWLLGKQTNDVDIAVKGNTLSVAKEIANNLGGKFVLLDEANTIARVIIEKEPLLDPSQNRSYPELEWHFDFSSFKDNIHSDLTRRDFSINAMAVELSQFVSHEFTANQSRLELIDPFHGEKDLRAGILRALNEQIFQSLLTNWTISDT